MVWFLLGQGADTAAKAPMIPRLFLRRVAGCLAGAAGCVLAAEGQAQLDPEGIEPDLYEKLERILPDEEEPETVLEARRQAQRAAQALLNELNAEGYFAAQAETAGDPGPPIAPKVRIDPGRVFTIDEVEVRFADPPPSIDDLLVARAAVGVEPGDRADPEAILKVEFDVPQALQRLGYPYAEVASRDVVGDRAEAKADVEYVVAAGPKVRFGEVKFPGDLRTRETYLARLSPIVAGEIYDPEVIGEYNNRLVATRVFSTAVARLSATPSSVDADGVETRDVELTLIEGPRHTIALGVSFGTDEGFGAQGQWTRRNLTGRADSLTALARIAQLEQSLELQWRVPNRPRVGRTSLLRTGVSREDTDAFDRVAGFVAGSVEAGFENGLSYSVGGEIEVVREMGEVEERTLAIFSLTAGARIDRSDDPLNPTRGWRADARVEPSVAVGDDPTQFLRSTAQVSGYVPFGAQRRVVGAARLRVGSVFGADLFDLPTDRRFFAGGGASVRGFGFQDVGERDAEENPIGGRGLFEASTELRWRVTKNIGLVAFVDAGSVNEDPYPGFDDVAYGAGAGVRYLTPAGPIRLDIAAPINPTEFDDPVQVYISIGQAF